MLVLMKHCVYHRARGHRWGYSKICVIIQKREKKVCIENWLYKRTYTASPWHVRKLARNYKL